MTENVIEKQIREMRNPVLTLGGPHAPEAEGYVRDALELAANELQAATRPEQFMPPLSEWPPEATLIVMEAAYHSGAVFIFYDKNDGHLEEVSLDMPPGIDPRIIVSRSDMERWESEQP